MAADKRSTVQDLPSSIEKALRRGRKLEKTLLKVVAQSDPDSAAEALLKSVQQGLKALKKEAKKVERSLSLEAMKAPAQEKPAPKPAAVARKPQRSAGRSRKKAPTPPGQASGAETPKA